MTKPPYVPTPILRNMPILTKKQCKRCGKVKDNDFHNFGKKVSGVRFHFVTLDVCKDCTREAISKGMKASWEQKFNPKDPFK